MTSINFWFKHPDDPEDRVEVSTFVEGIPDPRPGDTFYYTLSRRWGPGEAVFQARVVDVVREYRHFLSGNMVDRLMLDVECEYIEGWTYPGSSGTKITLDLQSYMNLVDEWVEERQ